MSYLIDPEYETKTIKIIKVLRVRCGPVVLLILAINGSKIF